MCGGGGGGGGTVTETRYEYEDLLGRKQNVSESEYGKTMGLNPLTAGTRLQSILANPTELIESPKLTEFIIILTNV